MKKILAVLFCLSLTVLAGSLTACQQHEHSFAETLSYNETEHWFAATCEHTEEKSCLSFHTFGEWQTVIEPTYEAKGEEKRSCVCGYYQTREMDSIPGSVGLQYVETADGTYVVSGIGTCTDTDVIIPKTHNDKAVTGIEPDVFWKRGSLRSVVIPGGVTSIGEWAFHDCTSLTSVV
ncbi:MAG: hypothetical protein IIY09_03530, partial [Clostridia bacterium]|nr:hypothetical protein [Clostridia bacterium]